MIPPVVEIIPHSKGFIKEVPKETIERIKRLKIDVKKERIKVFTIPYFGTDKPIPVEAHNVIIYDYIHRVYYRCFVFTEPVINYPQDCFEFLVRHESIELKLRERILRARIMTARDFFKIDEEASKRNLKFLEEKWGKERLEKALREGTILTLNAMRTIGKSISSGFLTYWLTKHFEQEYEKYKHNAIPMTPAMLTPRYKAWRKNIFKKVENVLRKVGVLETLT